MDSRSSIRTLLAVGGLDPSGGAGVLVDGHAARSLRLHAAAVVALVTVQDGRTFRAARPVDSELVRQGIESVIVSQDVGAIKTGALGSAAIVEVIAELAASSAFPPLVVDPVIGSTSGGELLDERGFGLLRDQLIPAATLVTPNAAEAAALAEVDVGDAEGAERAAERLLEMGARAVLVKGGHLPGDQVTDLLARAGEATVSFESPRLAQADVRGTGCALASLVAGYLALGSGLVEAVQSARKDLQQAMQGARSVGSGPPVLWFE